jgi:hypothetical protein
VKITPAVFDGYRLTPATQSWMDYKPLTSSHKPGPMVEESVTFLTYTPFDVVGFNRLKSVINASKFP